MHDSRGASTPAEPHELSVPVLRPDVAGGGSRQTDFFRLAGRAEMGSASDDLWPYLGFETPRTPLNSAALNPPEPGRRVLGISPKGQMLGLGFWKVKVYDRHVETPPSLA